MVPGQIVQKHVFRQAKREKRALSRHNSSHLMISSHHLFSSYLALLSSTQHGGSYTTGLPFPLPSALDQSSPRTLATSFSIPYRTSTSLNLTPLNSTQLTSLFDLLGLHFGASWPPQIDPRSAPNRSKSPLEAIFFKNVNFHEASAGVLSGAFPGFPRRSIDPRRLQDDLQDLFFRLCFYLRFWFVLGPI